MVEYSFFETIVAGENPEELMKPYDSNITVDEYIVYTFKDAHKLKKEKERIYQKIIDNNISNGSTIFYQDELNSLKNMSDEDAYFYLTSEYDLDDNNNAVSTKNPNGEYSFYQKGKLFSVPFITYDGVELFQARKKDIDWSKMHLNGQEIYRIAWEMVMEGRKPSNLYEEKIYTNMKERTAYFQSFGNKENYVIHSTAFWAYAFVDKNGWVELDETTNQFDWVSNFYEKFIEPLDAETLLTIYECKK